MTRIVECDGDLCRKCVLQNTLKHFTAVAKFQSTKSKVNVWKSPEEKARFSEFAKTTSEKSVQKDLRRLIKKDSGIDRNPKEK